MKKRSLHLLLASAVLTFTSAQHPAFAQRAYQRFWTERYKKMESPEIIEDQEEPRDIEKERYLFNDERAQILGWSVFPGISGDTEGAIKFEGLNPYTDAALSAEMGNATRAIRAFDEALKQDPDNVWVKLRLAEACMMLNDLSRAQSLLDDILKTDPENFRALLSVAEIHVLKREYNQSKEWFQKVLRLKAKNVMALSALAQIAFEIDRNMPEAKKYADEILLIDDGNVNAMLWSAHASAFTGETKYAADLYVRLLRYRPGMLDQMTEVARQLVILDRADDARILYEKAILVSPENDDPRKMDVKRAWEALIQKDGGEKAVRDAYLRLIDESKNDLKIFNVYADYLKRSNDWPAVIELRNKALEIDSRHVPSLLDLAEANLQDGEFDKAEPFFNRAIDANASDPEVYRLIAQAFVKAQKYERASELFNRAIALSPSDVDSMMSLALLQEKLGKTDEAEKLLLKALEASPVNAEVFRQLGSHFLRKGDRRKAGEYYSQAINTKEGDVGTWLALAQLYMEDEDKTALDHLEDLADQRLSEVPEFYNQYGRLAQMFGDFERSRRALEKGIKIQPGSLLMRAAAARAYLELNMPDLAIKSLNDADPYIKESETLKAQKLQFLATLNMELNRYADAQKIWESLAKSNPDDLEIREQLIISLAKQNKDDAVKSELNNVTREFAAKKPVEAQLLRASVFRAQGDASRGVGILKQLVAENPDNHEIWFNLALSASDAGDVAIAEQYYTKLIEIGPGETNTYYETSANNLGYLLAQKGIRLDEAEALIKKAQEMNPNAAYILDSLGWLYMQKQDYTTARTYLEKAAKRSRDAEVYSNLGQLYEKINEKDLAREYYDKALETDPSLKLARERRDALAVKDSPTKTQ